MEVGVCGLVGEGAHEGQKAIGERWSEVHWLREGWLRWRGVRRVCSSGGAGG